MKRFKNLEQYSNDELIDIAIDGQEDWQKEAIIQAWEILENRGVSKEYAHKRIEKIRRVLKIYWEEELKSMATESLDFGEVCYLVSKGPFIIFFDWGYKKQGYIRKSKQRINLILGVYTFFLGIILYAMLAMPSDDEALKERVDYINEVARQDSIIKSKIDWSGNYVFNDASTGESTTWILNITKSNSIHTAKLTIVGSDKNYEIDCDAVINNKVIEFYPDTTYTIRGQNEISYYDCLFSFDEMEGEIFTTWYNLKPFHNQINNSSEIFKLSTGI